MDRIANKGECLVYVGESEVILPSFKGYDVLEVGKPYIVDYCFNRGGDYDMTEIDISEWYISLVGIGDYGYPLDCFEPLSDVRDQKLNKLLD